LPLLTRGLLTRLQCKSPALANNAGLSSNCLEQRLKVAELFSRLFFVAASRLNSPRFFHGLLKHRSATESRELGDTVPTFTISYLRFTV